MHEFIYILAIYYYIKIYQSIGPNMTYMHIVYATFQSQDIEIDGFAKSIIEMLHLRAN